MTPRTLTRLLYIWFTTGDETMLPLLRDALLDLELADEAADMCVAGFRLVRYKHEELSPDFLREAGVEV